MNGFFESILKHQKIKQRGRAFCRQGRHKALHLDMFGQEDNKRGVNGQGRGERKKF